MLFTFYNNVIFITILNVSGDNVEFSPLSILSNNLLRLRNNEIGAPDFSVAPIILTSTFFKTCQV